MSHRQVVNIYVRCWLCLVIVIINLLFLAPTAQVQSFSSYYYHDQNNNNNNNSNICEPQQQQQQQQQNNSKSIIVENNDTRIGSNRTEGDSDSDSDVKIKISGSVSNSSSSSTQQEQLENQNTEQMEDIRERLLASIPKSLHVVGGGSSNDVDIDKAMDFLDAHIDKEPWKQTLTRFVMLKEQQATAAAAAQHNDPELISQLLNNPNNKLLLEEMLVADGPSGGNYGKAMEIYEEILEESDAVEDAEFPVLHRMAVAIALVHATPVVQTNPLERQQDDDDDDQPPEPFVDPVRRYLNYEVAYLDGELDPNFATLSIWELRFVIDGDEPDEIAAWGRQTLRNFYPDHVLSGDKSFMYAGIVRTDIPYGSSRVSLDDPTLHKYQNILRNGGICGRRAFFGRFILRAFGIPTTARPSKGHAALVHWTPSPSADNWVTNLGGGWGKGWTKTRYVKDLDFLATTQARGYEDDYKKVKLAQWIGDLFDEKRVYGIHDEKERGRDAGVRLDLQNKDVVGLWYRLSLKVQESIIVENNYAKNPTTKKNSGSSSSITTIAETVSKQKSQTGSCRHEGTTTIHIPAASFANPKNTKDVKVMKGFATTNVVDAEGEATACARGDSDSDSDIDNQQIYLPSFSPQGTTIMRGGTWKDDPSGLCTSGARLLSGGYGKYDNWGLRAAMTYDDEMNTNNTCPEPTLVLSLSDDGDDVTIEFVYIPPGQFVMGGTSTTDGRFNCVEVPHHVVKITRGFYLGKYPVTQRQYQAMAKNGKNPSKSTKDPNCPVDNIGVDDALLFCQSASEVSGTDIRLPTEAEWEYAARANTSPNTADQKWFFSTKNNDESKMGDYAWYKGNAGGKSHPVGLKKPNPFGVYDIYGNVCERVSDTYKKEYYAEHQHAPDGAVLDPTGPSQGVKSKFKYELKNIPAAGNYLLTAKVCTVNVQQRLKVSLNDNADAAAAVVMELPYTLGEWRHSEPVVLLLKQGENTLHFWRDNPPQYGLSIKEFTLTKAN